MQEEKLSPELDPRTEKYFYPSSTSSLIEFRPSRYRVEKRSTSLLGLSCNRLRKKRTASLLQLSSDRVVIELAPSSRENREVLLYSPMLKQAQTEDELSSSSLIAR